MAVTDRMATRVIMAVRAVVVTLVRNRINPILPPVYTKSAFQLTLRSKTLLTVKEVVEPLYILLLAILRFHHLYRYQLTTR